ERAALAGTAELERLELADDLEGERVVQLAHVDVAYGDARRRERAARGAPTDVAVGDARRVASREVPARGMPVRGAHPIRRAAEQVYGRRGEVGDAVGARQHEGAASL